MEGLFFGGALGSCGGGLTARGRWGAYVHMFVAIDVMHVRIRMCAICLSMSLRIFLRLVGWGVDGVWC